jgi:hypothetical protein
VRVAAVVRLVIEEKIERGRERLLDRRRAQESSIAQSTEEISVAQAVDVAHDFDVIAYPRGA